MLMAPAQISKSFRLSRCTYIELLRAPANGPQYVDLRFSPAGALLCADDRSPSHTVRVLHRPPRSGYVSTETRMVVSFETKAIAVDFLTALQHTLNTVERHAPTYIGLESILAVRDKHPPRSGTPGAYVLCCLLLCILVLVA